MPRTRAILGALMVPILLMLPACGALQDGDAQHAADKSSAQNTKRETRQSEASESDAQDGQTTGSSDDGNGSNTGDNSDDGGTAATPEPPAKPEPELGSRENPFPIDNPVHNDQWQVVLDEPYEAWDEIHAENQFNDPPADGMEFWILPVTVTYVGEDSGTPMMDMDFAFVGDDARTYSDRCGVIPNPLSHVGELYPGGTAEANVCITVPAGAPGLWTVAASFTDPVFFTTDQG